MLETGGMKSECSGFLLEALGEKWLTLFPPASRSSPHSLALTLSPSSTGPIPSHAAMSAV